MLLGKRPRPPIKRTTSMRGITVDITNVELSDPSDHHLDAAHQLMNFGHNNCDQRLLTAMVSPRNNYQQQQQVQRNNSKSSNEFMEAAHFLRNCGLCNRRLAPGKDIYMYRGDTGFCSLECREQQMKQDERKEKFAASSSMNKEESHKNHAAASSKKTETVAAT